MTISRAQAVALGALAVMAVVALQAFNSFACYQHDFQSFVDATVQFVAPALVVALVCLAFPNPLRAVVACAFFAPWLVIAYFVDCVSPGKDASLIYVAVLLWGTASALVGAFLGARVATGMGFRIK
jgi:hypothetical protein